MGPWESETLTWDWREETTAHPDHFYTGDVAYGACSDGVDNDADGLIDYPEDPECGDADDSTEGSAFQLGWDSARSLTFEYALSTQTLNGLSFSAAPGVGLVQMSEFADPEQTQEGAALQDIQSDQSRWLRASFAEPRSLQSSFKTWGGVVACTEQPPFDPCAGAMCNWHLMDPQTVIYPPDFVAAGAWANLVVVWPGYAKVTDTVIGMPESGIVQRIALADGAHWASQTEGSAAAAPLSPTGLAGGLSVLWVEHSAADARWALFGAESGETFATMAEGHFPFGVSDTARAVAAGDGSVIALFDRAAGRLNVFDPSMGSWRDVAVPTEVFERDGAAIAVLGSEFVALGGVRDVEAPEGWLIHLGSGAARAWNFGAPERQGAQLTLGAEPGTLVLVGGRDASDVLHDDVWAVRPAAHTSEAIFADSALAESFDRRVAIIPPSAFAPGAAFSATTGGQLVRQKRDASGWHEAACPPGQIRGYAAYGLDGVWLGSGAAVTGGPIGGAGGIVELDVSAQVEAIVTASEVVLNKLSTASGILAAGPVTIDPDATVDGSVEGWLDFGMPTLDCAAASSPVTGAPDVLVARSTQTDLAPGDYHNVVLEAQGLLRLFAGSYRLDSLTFPTEAHIAIVAPEGTVHVEIRTGLQWQGEIDTPEASQRLIWTYFGTGPLVIASALVGTLVAPDADVELHGSSVGAVFAKRVQMNGEATLTHAAALGDW